MHCGPGYSPDSRDNASRFRTTRKRGEARARRDAGFRAAVKAYRKPYVEPPTGKTRAPGSMHRRACYLQWPSTQ